MPKEFEWDRDEAMAVKDAEIERLRAALEEIMEKQCGGGAYAIARNALANTIKQRGF